MGFKVNLVSSPSIFAKNGEKKSFKITLGGGGTGSGGSGVATKLSDLDDVDRQGIGNRFVLVYDSVTNAFKFVNPDEVVNAAAGGASVAGGAPTPDGFSQETIDELDVALDNKIDLDAGDF
tara:strand:+ start:2422 stop:2784 length:363 start_codon:yes stop_codon:yes gene_type:complete